MAERTLSRNTLSPTNTKKTLVEPLSPLSTRRTLERFETRPTQDASEVLDLPYGTLAETADMREYTEETAQGILPKRNTN